MTFKKILCPIDFSAGSREAMRVASQLAHDSDAELVLIHVWQPPYIYGPETAFMPDLMAELRKDADHGLAKWKAEAEDLGARKITTIAVMGAAWDHIVETAAKDKAIDLLVIGTHGRTGLKRVLLGSVAEKVVRHAPCPVLVVRSRD